MFVAHAAVPGVTEPAQIAIVLVFVDAVYAALAWHGWCCANGPVGPLS